MATIMLFYVPCGSEGEAMKIASALLDDHLIACANLLTSRSLYRWEGARNDTPETILLCKTVPSREAAVRARVRAIHSYGVPCILSWSEAEVNSDYAAWVSGEVLCPVRTTFDKG